MAADVVVRPATSDDHAAVARLYIQLKNHHRRLQPGNPRYEVDDEKWAAVARRAIEDPNIFVFVAQVGGRVAGFMKITYEVKPWGISCEVETMVVEERER